MELHRSLSVEAGELNMSSKLSEDGSEGEINEGLILEFLDDSAGRTPEPDDQSRNAGASPVAVTKAASATNIRQPEEGASGERPILDPEQAASGSGEGGRRRLPGRRALVRTGVLCFTTFAVVCCVMGLVTWYRVTWHEPLWNETAVMRIIRNASVMLSSQDMAIAPVM
ncbi:uncharacterized protein LOC135389935 [Ornithodoros turicata]|uniref:uncharacterized protein LOC135389935 n=1 Tax=Ornithodoros turicata TaxID=34597 RepID=UPI003139B092